MYGDVVWTGKPNTFFGLPINFTRYILTDKKLVIRQGFLNIHEDKVELYRIIDLSMNLPLGQRIFQCGTIHVTSKDASIPNLDLKAVRDPHGVHNMIEEGIEKQKKNYGVLGRDMYGASMHLADGSIDSEVDDIDDFDAHED